MRSIHLQARSPAYAPHRTSAEAQAHREPGAEYTHDTNAFGLLDAAIAEQFKKEI
jgi:hypothetical protein